MAAPTTPLQDLEAIAAQIFERWDADQRSGKLLTALEGRIVGYDPRVTRIRTCLEAAGMIAGGEADPLWLRIQMLIVGHTVEESWKALTQALACVVGFAAEDREGLAATLDLVRRDLAEAIDLNWTEIRAKRAESDAFKLGEPQGHG